MRRAGNLWLGVVSFAGLMAAARRAARGKRDRVVVARFLTRLEPEVLELQRELESGAYRPGTPFRFEIQDPKTRTISAAPFRDRVVHHALLAVLEPVWDRRMIHESFACRRGKGTHAALRHARRMVRAHPWFLKLDIRKCFESLKHEVVLESVRRTVKDRQVFDLLGRIVGATEGDRGLPIGSLTSQWLANLTLDRLDHHVKEVLRVPGYVRYMDDFALFDSDRDRVRTHLVAVRSFVEDELDLRLKDPATLLAPSRTGLPFLGWRVRPGGTRLRSVNARRSRRRLRERRYEWERGWRSAEQLADSVRSIVEHLRQGRTLGLRRAWFAPGSRFVTSDEEGG